jgi:glycosyltransferase involved in cell wall biosynthesis
MHLCVVTPNVIKGDGQGRANYELVREAISRGHHVTLVASRVDDVLAGNPNIDVVRILPRFSIAMLFDVEARSLANRWLRANRYRFDLILVNGSSSTVPVDANVVQFTHHGWWHTPNHIWRKEKTLYSFYQLLRTAVERGAERRAFQSSRWHIAVSNRIKQELIELGVTEDSISVIYNGVDLNEFRPGPSRRETFGLPSSVPLALFAGDIRLNRKNLATVLGALTRLPNVHLAVAAPYVGRSRYPALARSLGLEARVHFVGARKDIADLMRSCDFFVFPSFYEGFALSVVEAMASALPVIVSDRTGTVEIVNADCGFVVSHMADEETLARPMRQLAEDPVLRARMGVNARRVAEQHSWKAKATQYLRFLESRNRAAKPSNETMTMHPHRFAT